VLVTADSLPFVRLVTEANRYYGLAVTLGNAIVTASDLANGNAASGSAVVEAKDEVVTLNLDLSPSRPKVVSVVPADAAIGVARTASVIVNFSRAIDLATLDAVSFTVRPGVAAPLDGEILLLSNGRTALFRPAAFPARCGADCGTGVRGRRRFSDGFARNGRTRHRGQRA
jgi:hypothetical protein